MVAPTPAAPRFHACSTHAERRRDGVGAALDGELDDVDRIEVDGIRSERRRPGVLDALVDGEDGHVARAGQTAGVEELFEVA